MVVMEAVNLFENKMLMGDLDFNPEYVFGDIYFVEGIEDTGYFIDQLRSAVMRFSLESCPNFHCPFGADEMRAKAKFYSHVAECFEKVDEIARWCMGKYN